MSAGNLITIIYAMDSISWLFANLITIMYTMDSILCLLVISLP